jgi:hypothetical protein
MNYYRKLQLQVFIFSKNHRIIPTIGTKSLIILKSRAKKIFIKPPSDVFCSEEIIVKTRD